MLALDDQALARVFIRATAIPHKDRSAWLQRLARQLDPSPNTQRVRAHRARLANGHRVFHLELDSLAIEAMLEREGLLSSTFDSTHQQIEQT
jgi:hypothetical protein